MKQAAKAADCERARHPTHTRTRTDASFLACTMSHTPKEGRRRRALTNFKFTLRDKNPGPLPLPPPFFRLHRCYSPSLAFLFLLPRERRRKREGETNNAFKSPSSSSSSRFSRQFVGREREEGGLGTSKGGRQVDKVTTLVPSFLQHPIINTTRGVSGFVARWRRRCRLFENGEGGRGPQGREMHSKVKKKKKNRGGGEISIKHVGRRGEGEIKGRICTH